MQKLDGKLIFSPSDLITFMDSKFDSWMARWSAEFPGEVLPDEADESHALLQKLGNAHEDNFLRKLKADGLDVAEVELAATDVSELATRKAMREGHQIIYQGVLSSDNFSGRTDFLYKVDGASSLGDFHYEVWDTKLAKKAKPYFVIQLCCYAEMLEAIQGVCPKSISIVLGDTSQKTFATNDYIYFYRQLKKSFLEFHQNFSRQAPPEDLTAGTFSRWKTHSERLILERDDLSRIANIRKVQIQRLKSGGIETMQGLADSPASGAPKMTAETFASLKAQAKLQIQTVKTGQTAYEFLPAVAGKGFALLPPVSPLDVYFDMEGYPHIDGGLEYLFGACFEESGELQFRDWWAHDRIQEKQAFEEFIDWAYSRWRQDKGMHIYHYAPYEVSAARRLAGRHATRVNEVDDLLRNEVFVDLFQIVRQGLQVGEPSYSIKYVEHLYREKRAGSVAKATDSVVFYERWIEAPDGEDWQTSSILNSIRNYNEEDCVSTQQLATWLRKVQKIRISSGDFQKDAFYTAVNTARSEQDAPPQTSAAAKLSEQLMADAEKLADPEERRVQELIAGLLEFHAREQKPIWWRYFDRRKMSDEELCQDLDCLVGLRRTKTQPIEVKKSHAFEYEFDPDQDTKIEKGDECRFLHDTNKIVVVHSIDRRRGRISIVSGPKAGCPPDNLYLVLNNYVSAKTIADSLYRIATNWQREKRLTPALFDFLNRREPHLKGRKQGEPIANSSDLNAVVDAIASMSQTTMCIQGPPGCGKTYTASHAIVALLKQGKRVGITSNSHKVIEHLLEKIAIEADSQGVPINAIKVAGIQPEPNQGYTKFGVVYAANASKFFAEDPTSYNLVAGTAWLFSDARAEGLLGYLFIDEAGQVCVANVAAMSSSAGNLVLIGDQMQLEQPIQGSHPGETGQSSLEYLLQEHATIPANFGIFLGTTHRMHPNLCQIVSSAIYESRLQPDPANELQVLVPDDSVEHKFQRTSGLVYLPVQHQGNSQSSLEEVDVIDQLVKDLRKCSFIDKLGKEHPVVLEKDILIVAPYNMQVRLISERIPGSQVASVDKFQGREAPIVILSMCASEGNGSPRGADFLFNKSRLNVAISRAKTLAFVVGSDDLLTTNCSTLAQMHLLNLFCHIVEAGCSEKSTGFGAFDSTETHRSLDSERMAGLALTC